jgi:hypothetical protein
VAAGYAVVIGILSTNAESVLLRAGAHRTFETTSEALEWLLAEGRLDAGRSKL